jgi:hypothetical protein
MVRCLRDFPASHRAGFRPSAVFISKLEVRLSPGWDFQLGSDMDRHFSRIIIDYVSYPVMRDTA